MTALLVLVWACGGECTLTLPEPEVDECAGACATLAGPPGAAYALHTPERDAALAEGVLDTSGRATLCFEGPLPRGEVLLSASVGGQVCEAGAEVRPFGWAWGLDKPSTRAVLDWIPTFAGVESPPELLPEPGAWDSATASMPALVEHAGQRLLFYAGAGPEGVYGLGLAREVDGDWVREPDAPLLDALSTGAEPGDWDYESQNTPDAVVVDGQLRLYYNGRDDVAQTLSVGLATSEDGRVFTPHPDNPVLAGGGVTGSFERGAVAHPAVLVREGVTELWFASGTLELGYALSADGVAFTRWCKGPVFQGNGPSSWDAGEVKAPSVVWDGERYWMAFSGGGKGAYQVGWAGSDNGLDWTAAPDPVIAPGAEGTWNSATVQGADLSVEGEVWTAWYAGHDGVTTSTGRVVAVR